MPRVIVQSVTYRVQRLIGRRAQLLIVHRLLIATTSCTISYDGSCHRYSPIARPRVEIDRRILLLLEIVANIADRSHLAPIEANRTIRCDCGFSEAAWHDNGNVPDKSTKLFPNTLHHHSFHSWRGGISLRRQTAAILDFQEGCYVKCISANTRLVIPPSHRRRGATTGFGQNRHHRSGTASRF